MGSHSAVAKSTSRRTFDAGKSRRAQGLRRNDRHPHYVAPQRWDAVDASALDALLLPGGHRARGMREYLESEILQRHVADFFDEEKPVAAICHGVLLAARSVSKHTGRSVLWGYQTTALTWAFENSAWSVARVTRFWDPNYYRTYPERDSRRALCRCSRR